MQIPVLRKILTQLNQSLFNTNIKKIIFKAFENIL